MVRVQKVGNQFSISIPVEKIRQAGLKKGDVLAIDYDQRTNQLILSKLKEMQL